MSLDLASPTDGKGMTVSSADRYQVVANGVLMEELERKTPDTPIVHRNLADMHRVLNQFVYQKGGWVLHMLRRHLGAETFWNGIREYDRRYRDRHASTDDLRRVMESASGQPLEWFFDQWLKRSGVPQISGVWRYDAAWRAVEVTVRQTQNAEPYRLGVDVGIVSAASGRPRIERMELAGRTATASFPSETEPVEVRLDPDTWLLMEGGTLVHEP